MKQGCHLCSYFLFPFLSEEWLDVYRKISHLLEHPESPQGFDTTDCDEAITVIEQVWRGAWYCFTVNFHADCYEQHGFNFSGVRKATR